MECARRSSFRQEDPMLALMLALVLFVPAAAASERADKPVVRSAAPSHLTARDDPAKDQPAHVRGAAKPHADTTAKININAADVKSLMTLTGVGRKVAEKIVEYRDSHGPFKK